ncbi:MAG: hypothetical protein ACD_74C00191G0002 [uncultured bacterium]|nr:MAG: hypothetical protein ACD_74C00191G0002 [uncultured bacterium]
MKTKWYDNKIIVFALLIFFLPAGLFGLWKSSKFERTGKIAWSVVGVLVLLVCAANQKTTPVASQQSELVVSHSSTPAVSQKIPEVYDKVAASELPVTYSEFEENFNSFGKSSTPAMQLYTAKLSPKNKGDKFATRQAMITENIILTTTEADSGRMGSVIMLGRGDGEFESGMDILMAMGAVMSGVDKAITSKQRGEILKRLGLVGGSGPKIDKPASTVMNGIKYSVILTSGVGLLFSAEKNI